MEDKKTTITGLVTLLVGVLAWFDIVIPKDFIPAIALIGVTVIGFFAKDGK